MLIECMSHARRLLGKAAIGVVVGFRGEGHRATNLGFITIRATICAARAASVSTHLCQVCLSALSTLPELRRENYLVRDLRWRATSGNIPVALVTETVSMKDQPTLLLMVSERILGAPRIVTSIQAWHGDTCRSQGWIFRACKKRSTCQTSVDTWAHTRKP